MSHDSVLRVRLGEMLRLMTDFERRVIAARQPGWLLVLSELARLARQWARSCLRPGVLRGRCRPPLISHCAVCPPSGICCLLPLMT